MNELTQDYNLDRKLKREMIDGKIYLMASASREHSEVQGNLHNIFNNYFRGNKRRCRAINDHEIYVNEKNFYEPDVKVLCRENRADDIPVIVIEVLSKSTQSRDYNIKMEKYAELGIKEYWIVDWKYCTVSVYLLEEKRYKHDRTYAYYASEEEIRKERLDEEDIKEIANEFSPVSFPELIVKLEDVFDIFE
jgi:Uma2 family endonuclease